MRLAKALLLIVVLALVATQFALAGDKKHEIGLFVGNLSQKQKDIRCRGVLSEQLFIVPPEFTIHGEGFHFS